MVANPNLEVRAAGPAGPARDACAVFAALLDGLDSVIRGKRETLELVVCCLAGGGHALLEDIPGTGKTTLARALATLMGCTFKRVQFTPDLLPTDILGASIYNPQTGTFSFKPGPIFAHVVIADEINRASPRTQSALLEALSEGQVTLDGETRSLPTPFLCVATQNPVEFHGTYPLPEAQLDRFSALFTLGYAPVEEEKRILLDHQAGSPLTTLKPVTAEAELAVAIRMVDTVIMEEAVGDYLLRMVHATRNHPGIKLGVSMRGALQFQRLCRARALVKGRAFVLPEDVKMLAPHVLAHRLVLDARARYAGQDKRGVLADVLTGVAVPR